MRLEDSWELPTAARGPPQAKWLYEPRCQGDGFVHIVKMLKKVTFGEVGGYRELGTKGDTAEPRSN